MKRSNKINLTTLVLLITMANYLCGCGVIRLGIGGIQFNPNF